MTFKDFLDKYFGMIIGILIAVLFIAFGLVQVLECIALIIVMGWLGKYVQTNKEAVKETLKRLIDRF